MQPTGRVIELLPLVDLDNLPRDGGTGIELPYRPPPGGCDFILEFTRGRWDGGTVGQDSPTPVRGLYLSWIMSGVDGRLNRVLTGPDRQDGAAARVPFRKALADGGRYTSVLRVRPDGVRAYLDGELALDYKTDFGEFIPGGQRRDQGQLMLYA